MNKAFGAAVQGKPHTLPLLLLSVFVLVACGDDVDLGEGDSAIIDSDAAVMADATVPMIDANSEPDGGVVDGGVLDGGVVDDGLHPVLSVFRVEAGEDRLFFDSSEPIFATEASGFIVSNKTVGDVVINSGSTTGHYFSITEGFTFWDNTTIRYEGGSDLADRAGNALYEFTLQYVANNVPEPSSSIERYVSRGGGGAHDGTSEADAWTMAEAGAQAVAGQTVWIKAGDYGDRPLDIDNDGSPGSPIKFIGYTSTPGDAPTLMRDQDTRFDSALMPHIHSTSDEGFGVRAAQRHHVIIKNIQITGYQHSLRANGNASELLIENVYVRGGAYGFHLFAYETTNTRVRRSYASDNSSVGIRVAGDHNLIDDIYVSSRGTPDMDYYISLYGGTIGLGNIVLNSAVVRDPSDTHTGHGISVKASGRPIEQTLIEDCTIHEIGQGIELRHHQVRYTVARGVVATGNRASVSNLVTFRDDTSYNIIENCIADGVQTGVKFAMNAGEDEGIQAGGHHNRVVNTVFDNCRYGVLITGFNGTPLESTDNSFEHCTFYELDFMFALPIDFGDSNTFTSCNLSQVAGEVFRSGTPTTSYANSNIWESWGMLPGEDDMSVDPMFVDDSGPDFTPQNAALNTSVEAPNVHYDINGRERVTNPTLGAFETD